MENRSAEQWKDRQTGFQTSRKTEKQECTAVGREGFKAAGKQKCRAMEKQKDMISDQ